MECRKSLIAVLTVAAISCGGSFAQDLPAAPSAVKQQQAQSKALVPAETPKPPSTSGSIPVPTTVAPSAVAPSVDPVRDPDVAAPAAKTDTVDSKPAPKPAAAPDSDTNEHEFTVSKNVDEVNVVFTATDGHGRFVKDLQQSDVLVLDDNRPPDRIVKFTSQTDLPLRVGLLIDISSSIRDRFKFEQEAAIEFLNQIIRAQVDRAFVLGFDTTADITQDFTGDTELLARGIRALRPGGGTAMFDALYLSCRDKLMKEKDSTPTRRAIILLSDGEDNQSRVTREEAIEMAQRADTVVYTISTNISGVKLRGDKILERIADATGGRSFFPFRVEDVSNAFTDIQEELRSQYSIAYKPANFLSDGRLRSIAIFSKNRKLHVRSRVGYYAPKSGGGNTGMP